MGSFEDKKCLHSTAIVTMALGKPQQKLLFLMYGAYWKEAESKFKLKKYYFFHCLSKTVLFTLLDNYNMSSVALNFAKGT